MQQSFSTTNSPYGTAAQEREYCENLTQRFMSGHTPAAQEFVVRHIEKQRAKLRTRSMSPKRTVSRKDQALVLRFEILKAQI